MLTLASLFLETKVVDSKEFSRPLIVKHHFLTIRHLAKLGTDSFSLVSFGTKVSDSKEFCKKSILHELLIELQHCVHHHSLQYQVDS